MPYFYNDADGNRKGPFNVQQLRVLASRRAINLSTPMVMDTGQQGLAWRIPGLFQFTFTDANGTERTVNSEELRTLAAQGIITQTTPLETGEGIRVLAEQLPGLSFATVEGPLTPIPSQIEAMVNKCMNKIRSWKPGVAIVMRWGRESLKVIKKLLSIMFSHLKPKSSTSNPADKPDLKPQPPDSTQPKQVPNQVQFTDEEQMEIDRFCAIYGGDVKRRYDGKTLLHIAAAADAETLGVVKYLISQGADVNAKENDGWTPLHYAAQSYYPNSERIVRHLVDMGANVKAKAREPYNSKFPWGRELTPVDCAHYSDWKAGEKESIIRAAGGKGKIVSNPSSCGSSCLGCLIALIFWGSVLAGLGYYFNR